MDPLTIAGAVAIIVFSLGVHEAAHAWAALKLGDPTAYRLGRLTLNPVPHIDLFMTILLPLFLFMSTNGSFIFGGAKPVPVDFRNLRNPHRDNALIAAAGPFSNFLQAFFWGGLLSVLIRTGVWTWDSKGVEIVWYGIVGNMALAIFNMIPVPPLDGSRVAALLMDPATRMRYLTAPPFITILALLLALRIPGVRTAIFAAMDPLIHLVLVVTRVPVG